MVWNTIAHPRMMDDTSGTSNTPESGENNTPIFSEEALASPIKHMNRALLSTFDVIVMAAECSTDDDDLISKQIPLLGDFDTVYRAAKSGALLNVMYVAKSLMLDQDGILQPIDGSPLSLFSGLSIPIVLEGKYENGFDITVINPNVPIDFKDDRFVYIQERNIGLVFSSAGEIYDISTWLNTIFPKYRITSTDSESENHN